MSYSSLNLLEKFNQWKKTQDKEQKEYSREIDYEKSYINVPEMTNVPDVEYTKEINYDCVVINKEKLKKQLNNAHSMNAIVFPKSMTFPENK